MSIDYTLFRFASAPRTGTTWFLKACSAVGLGVGFKASAHTPHNPKDRTSFKVSLARNPCDWLASYYTAIHRGCTNVTCVDRFMKMRDDSYESFVLSYLTMMPGAIGEMLTEYNADSYLRIEDMPWAFVELLESLGVPRHLRQRCYNLGKQNVSKRVPRMPSRLRRRILESESRMVEDFGYH